MRIVRFCFLLTGCLAIFSCSLFTQKKKLVRSPAGYNLSAPQTIRLDENLDEISGIAYDAAGPMLLAINDEEGRKYTVSLPDGKVKRGARFAKGGDFEDIVLLGKSAYVLKSNGDLYTIKDAGADSLESVKTSFPIKGRFDFETLFLLPASGQLVLLCKTCPQQTNQVPGYLHNPETGQTIDSVSFRLDFSSLPDSFPQPGKSLLHPSGAAIHPVTGDLFILASANGLLVLADQRGTVKQSFKLDRKVFKQPEGICFAPDGGMYISNEAGTGFANIHYFPYEKKP
jgi:uncharacterized protein YjiK